MSVDPKKFGITPSLLETVKEALKGDQHKLDVAEPKGKLTSADFKKLRGEGAKPDHLDFDKDGNKKEPMKKALKQMKEVADGNKANFKANMKEDAEIVEAAPPPAPQPNVGAAMDARKSEVQRKIAQKQAAHQQAKANRRISGTMKEAGDKCSCGEDNGSKMKCEVHGGPRNRQMVKGGKEQIVVNPPLKEAGELPKKVVTKGHEIAKSLIKHRAKVRSPYAVGMATAKKSASIKEDAEQVDELSKGTVGNYIKKASLNVSKQTDDRTRAHYGDDDKGFNRAAHKLMNRQNGIRRAVDKLTKEEVEQIDEVSAEVKKNNPLVFGDKKKSNPLVYGDKKRDNPLVHGDKKKSNPLVHDRKQ